jgi:hypothetical protein
MDSNIKEKVELSIKNLKDKKSRIYFLVQDTKGNAKASVRYIYQMAKSLYDAEFNPIILHEKNDYTGVSEWLGEEYMKIKHSAIEEKGLEITPDDFLIIPEVYGFVMEQVKNLPCAKIVLSQQYSAIVETLQPGQSWSNFGFLKCMTTSGKQKEYLEKIMRKTTYDVITPIISDTFKPNKKPPMPIVGVHTKDQSDTVNIIKSFYLRFPQYRWITFRDLRGLSESEFAKSLSECFLSVWVDDKSSFGTFPLESMACSVPVVGRIPNVNPEWMEDNNGVWVQDQTLIIDFVADFIQSWLEDGIKPELYDNMKSTVEKYQNKDKFSEEVVGLFSRFFEDRSSTFEQQLNKIDE